ncbi:MAG: PilZ domain-containing protein [Brevinematia bacterium]
MVKVGIITNSAVLSKSIAIFLISRGYYANHIFTNQFEEQKDFDIFVIDFDGINKIFQNQSTEILDKLQETQKPIILITHEKSSSKLQEFAKKGVKGIVDSNLNISIIPEKIYEIIQTLPIKDDDKRKHYRVPIDFGILKVEIPPSRLVEGKITDISAGGIGAIFKTEEEANMFINNKAYPCEVVVSNIAIKPKIFLVRRDGLLCGFKFFGLDEKQLSKISELIYHNIIEKTHKT